MKRRTLAEVRQAYEYITFLLNKVESEDPENTNRLNDLYSMKYDIEFELNNMERLINHPQS